MLPAAGMSAISSASHNDVMSDTVRQRVTVSVATAICPLAANCWRCRRLR